MDYIFEGIREALRLIFTLDREVFGTVLLSLKISTAASFFASLVGIPMGFFIGTHEFAGKKFVITGFNTLMAFPTVVVGLLVFSFTSRRGPFGPLELLFTPTAMIIGQFILVAPIIIALTLSATQGIDPRIRLTAMTLGANSFQTTITILNEVRFALMAALIAGFGRVIAEVGCAMMVGGNIRGYTRTMTTTIALETAKGEFGFSLALGFILLIVAFSVNIFLHQFQSQKS